MVFSWFKDRRKELLAEPFPAAWHDYLAANMRHYAYLDPAGQERVQTVVRVLVAEKHWDGGRGFAVSDEMRVTVAAQASLLVLGLDEPYYFDRVQSIILYPDIYIRPPQFRQYYNGPRSTRLLGEAWYHSPIVLSWKHVLQAGRNQSNGGNVVLHEFAHHLDGLDGQVDGTPPLAGREREKTWYRVSEAEYRRLVGAARRHEVTLLNQYGATNRAEFFAVATECFFEQPRAMRRQHEELYAVLCGFLPPGPGDVGPTRRFLRRDRPADGGRTARGGFRGAGIHRCRRGIHIRRNLPERRARTPWPRRPLRAPSTSIRPTPRRISIARRAGGAGQCMAALNDCNRAIELDG